MRKLHIIIGLVLAIVLIQGVSASTKTVEINSLGEDASSQCSAFYYNYGNADVSFTYEASDASRLKGVITASNLRPNTTYQVKLLGKPSCIYGAQGDDTVNEIIGYKGRWTCPECGGGANGRNKEDADYEKCQADLLCTDCIQGYLVFGYFTTDQNGYAQKYVESDSSYHVLFCNDGTCDHTGNIAARLDETNAICPKQYVDGEIERGSCGSLTFSPRSYNAVIALTFESFHQGSDCWATVLMNDTGLDFTITGQESQPCGKQLDYLDIGNTTSEAGHDLQDWSYVGDPNHDGNGYLKHGNYGDDPHQYDDGGNLRGIMGTPQACDSADTAAYFTMHAGSGIATQLVVRNLDGSQDDSFNVSLWNGTQYIKVGRYPFDGNKAEEWKTTTFSLPKPMTGDVRFKFVATDPATPWCSSGYGQVAINWVRLNGCEYSCSDSDGGDSPDILGFTTGLYGTATDFCRTDSAWSTPSCEALEDNCRVHEYFCGDYSPGTGDFINSIEHNCQYGCEDGACLTEPPTPPIPEFTTVAAMVALLGAVTAFAVMRKRW